MRAIVTIQIIFFLIPAEYGFSQNPNERINVARIYSDDNYNAFTSLVKFRGKFYCVFRSGENHVYGEGGVVKIIMSKDGKKWKAAATILAKGYDLRDPKLSITPEGQIMVNMGGSVYQGKKLLAGKPFVSFSNKRGTRFSKPKAVQLDPGIGEKFNWLWRASWYQSSGYAGVYKMVQNSTAGNKSSIFLLNTMDGLKYNLVKALKIAGKPSESTIRVMADGEMLMMIRRDQGDKKAFLGKSRPPYTHWQYINMPFSVGGPDFIPLDENHFVGGGRINGQYTALFTFTRDGNFKEILRLPSNADSSYPGFVTDGGKLFVSYYSSHETAKAAIYFAKIPLDYFDRTID